MTNTTLNPNALKKRLGIRVVTINDPTLTEHDTTGLTGWVHDCGAFVFKLSQPDRCGVCWSALRNAQAHNGNWQRAYVTKEAS
ncbi:hypothetical protein [Kribbella sp. NPDC051137]|uniref:hypothetical protein n=1 Tax=Kribbella sp. NPDC051137 TaxID=3155045 RepID=UPI00343F0ED9